MFIAFMPRFKAYRDELASTKEKSDADPHVIASVDLLLSALSSDYRATLAKIKRFKSHQEITFDFVFALLVPRMLFVTKCAVTGNPRLFKLVSTQRTAIEGKSCYQLICESVDLIDRLTNSSVTPGVSP